MLRALSLLNVIYPIFYSSPDHNRCSNLFGRDGAGKFPRELDLRGNGIAGAEDQVETGRWGNDPLQGGKRWARGRNEISEKCLLMKARPMNICKSPRHLGKSLLPWHFSVASVEGSSLVISSASRVHIGVYYCIASNGVTPIKSKSIALQVQCKLEVCFRFKHIWNKCSGIHFLNQKLLEE